ncbi:MAG TPA: hypothetical protein VHN59_09715 [Chitinophagaceae bacterium]|nr:hypothetical protein [Chitinophagaceae bacterium]
MSYTARIPSFISAQLTITNQTFKVPLKLITLCLFFNLSIKSQPSLYDDGNIRLTYTTQVLKTVYCSNKNGTIYFVTAKYHLENYSSKNWFVNLAWGMNYIADGNLCPADDDVAHFKYQATSSGLEGTVKAGANYYGEDGAWFTSRSPIPGHKIIVKTLWSAPKINTNTNTGSTTNTSAQSKQPGYGIYQNDNIVNPKTQVPVGQKQQQENAATANAMNSYQNAGKEYNDELKRLNSIPNTYKAPTTPQQLQQKEIDRQTQIAASQKRIQQIQQQLEEQKRRYRQTQIDFSNAQISADNAYSAAIASGKKESGAMLDATLSGAQQISDPTGQLVYTGVGLAVSLVAFLGEKKQERLEKEAAARREEERKSLIIQTKNKFIADAISINKYGIGDLVSKSRFAALLLVPKPIISDQEKAFFTIPVLVPQYADSTYPLKDEIEKKLLKALTLDKDLLDDMKVYTLYPITNVEKFQEEFIKKMGSGHLIYLSAELTDFSGYPFTYNTESGTVDFWNRPVKKESKAETNKQIKNDFWNQ